MKLLLLRKTNEEGPDLFLGMVSDNVSDEDIEDAVETAFINLAAKYASRPETDREGSA